MIEQKETPTNSNRLKHYFQNLALGFAFLVYWFRPHSLDFTKDEAFYDKNGMDDKSVLGVNYFRWNQNYSWLQRILMVELQVHWSRLKFSMNILLIIIYCYC
jgi:hypothetical protein